MDTLEKESGGGQSVRSSGRLSKKRKLGADTLESTSNPHEVPPRAGSKQHRLQSSRPDPHPRHQGSSTNAGVRGPATCVVPSPSDTTVSPEDQEQHPADVKVSSLLRQFQDVVGESSQSRIETDREHVERERELQAQISALSDEQDNAVRNASEQEEKLKTLALDLWESEKLRKNLQAKLEQEREGRSGVNVRLKTLAKGKRQLEKELSALQQERESLTQTLQQERRDAMEMLQQICEEFMAADDDLHEYLLEHLTPDDSKEVSEWRAIHSLTGRHPLAPSFACATTGAATKSVQDVVSREHWAKWLDYFKEERASALKTLCQKRSQTVQAFKQDIWEPGTPQAYISN